jgi:DNA repair exonuclease SbcCD ATPase subunit
MLVIKSVTLKNFLSTGAVTQSVDLTKGGLTLVLGENLDMGGNGSRNGVGKSTILQAISYGLYGAPLTNIKKDNLVNKINQKNMSVSIEFENNGHSYRIERGRKPQFFRYIVDDENVNSQDTDEAQGENKDTQLEIDKKLGMSHAMFKHIVALNTYTDPFLSLGASKQREIIEELLGIMQLSQKAEKLKELIKTTKLEAEKEELRLKTIKLSNERIDNTINDLRKKTDQWDQNHHDEIETLENAIASLAGLDIEAELKAHEDVSMHKELNQAITQLKRDINLKTRHANQLETQLNGFLTQYNSAANKECPMCSQSLKDHTHTNIVGDLEGKIGKLDQQLTTERREIADLQAHTDQITPLFEAMGQPQTFYPTLKEALNHKSTIEQLIKDLDRERGRENPYSEQTASLRETMQPIDYDVMNGLVKDREHQEFLLKLLTSKDSFIRKRIIDQNLSYLNSRLGEYLDKLGLPHTVKFLNDLTTEITILGQDLDFDNLSRGERTRLILGLSWSFRDIFENTNHAVNLMFVDELLDNGMDSAGLEGSIELLKKMDRERNKNVFVISHREELINRVGNILTVIKENGFSSFSYDYEAAV